MADRRISSPGGMGFHVAQHLALKGAKVYVSARSLEKALFAITTLKEQHPSLVRADLLHPLPLDLGDLKCVGAVVDEFEKKERRLDILVNNASM
jgi:NAD(P)-dependent dehydrogenase (short-subunit alcohol dehydrogenase family)